MQRHQMYLFLMFLCFGMTLVLPCGYDLATYAGTKAPTHLLCQSQNNAYWNIIVLFQHI